MGSADKVLGLFINVAHRESSVGVAVHAFKENGDVNVEDVAVLEGPAVGDTVADNFISGGTNRLREAAIIQRTGVAAALKHGLVRDAVQRIGGDSGTNGLAGDFQNLGSGLASFAQPLKFLRIQQCFAAAFSGAAALGIVRRRNVGRDGAFGAQLSGHNAVRLIAFSLFAQFSAVGLFVAAFVFEAAFAPAQVIGQAIKAHRGFKGGCYRHCHSESLSETPSKKCRRGCKLSVFMRAECPMG